MNASEASGALFPRRTLLAAGLSALVAGGAVGLAAIGNLSAVDQASFLFSRGTALANGSETQLRGFLAQALEDDRIVVVILGHSSNVGDETANLALSEERAVLAQEIATELGIARDRITATGVGGGAPLPKDTGESDRAYQSRLARVEVSLQRRR